MGKALSVRRTLEAITGAMALVLVVTSAILANGAYDEMRRAGRIVTALASRATCSCPCSIAGSNWAL